MQKTTREKKTVQLEEINQKVLAKEGRLKEISTKGKIIQTNQDIPKQRKKILSNWEGMTQKHTNNQTPKKLNNFRRKYGSRKSITKRLNG